MENLTNGNETNETNETSVAATEPVATEPVATEPVATEPVATEPKRSKLKAVKVKAKVEAGRGRGRPIVFKGIQKRHIISVIRKHGLTKGKAMLAGEKVYISLPTLGKFAAEAGIELHRGRPSKAA